MNRDAKRINPNLTADISRVENCIRNSNGRGFYGDGYVIKKAIQNLRKEGMVIIFDRKKCSYMVKKLTT
jgi:hypothetical protein